MIAQSFELYLVCFWGLYGDNNRCVVYAARFGLPQDWCWGFWWDVTLCRE